MTINFKNLDIETRSASLLMKIRGSNLKTLELHNLVDNNTKYLYNTFEKCPFEHIRFLNCVFKEVDEIKALFARSHDLKSIRVEYSENAVVSKSLGLFPSAKTTETMFESCNSLKYANISEMFKRGTLCSLNGMFNMVNGLEYMNLENLKFDTIGMMNNFALHECGALQKLYTVNVRYSGYSTIADRLNYIAIGNILHLKGVTVKFPKDDASRKVLFGKFDNDIIETLGVTIE